MITICYHRSTGQSSRNFTSPLVKLFVASRALESPSTPPQILSVVLPKDTSDLCVSIPAVTLFLRYSRTFSLEGRRTLALGVCTLKYARSVGMKAPYLCPEEIDRHGWGRSHATNFSTIISAQSTDGHVCDPYKIFLIKRGHCFIAVSTENTYPMPSDHV